MDKKKPVMEQSIILCSHCMSKITIEESVGSIYFPGRLICIHCSDDELEAKMQEENETQYENGYYSE